MDQISSFTQISLNRLIDLIKDTGALIDLSDDSIASKVGISTINSLKIAIEQGLNLVDVDNYCLENSQRCLKDHIKQRSIQSKINEALAHEIMRLILINQRIQFF